MIDILELRLGNNNYLTFYIEDKYIFCKNIKTGEIVIVGEL